MGRLIVSKCRDPRWNLALEEYLIGLGEPVLYLWRNDPSVIIGRNQNPYAECDPRKLAENHIYLVRRKSGGGAVYHDPGNLNITLLSGKTPDAVEKNFRFLTDSLRDLGIEAKVSGRNDLEADGKKISGSAFYETENFFCHHCTMLVSTDLSAMERYLTPSGLKLKSKGIASVRSRVANLQALQPALTAEALEQALILKSGLPPEFFREAELREMPEVSALAAVYESRQWNFEESPRWDLTLEKKFPWGLVSLHLAVESGKIRTCRIYTDCLRTEGFRALAESLQGLPFERESIRRKTEQFEDPEIRRDLLTMLMQ